MTNFLTYILILLFTFTTSVNACYTYIGNTGSAIFGLKNYGNENTNIMSGDEWLESHGGEDTIRNGSISLVSDLHNTMTGEGRGDAYSATAVGSYFGFPGFITGFTIDTVIVLLEAGVSIAAISKLINDYTSEDNSKENSGQEPKNDNNSSGNNGDNNGGNKEPNFCKKNPDKCNFLEKLAEKIKDFLGDEARQQNTSKGNKQFISKDNDRIIRFDIDGEKNPHINLEIRSEGVNEHIYFEK